MSSKETKLAEAAITLLELADAEYMVVFNKQVYNNKKPVQVVRPIVFPKDEKPSVKRARKFSWSNLEAIKKIASLRPGDTLTVTLKETHATAPLKDLQSALLYKGVALFGSHNVVSSSDPSNGSATLKRLV